MTNSNRNKKYKAMLFDMGGVVLKYKKPGTSKRLENELTSNHVSIKKMLQDHELGIMSFEELLPIANSIFKYNPEIYTAIEKLRENGYKIGLLTNNGFWTKNKKNSLLMKDLSLFDYVQESCRLGIGKPDPEFFKIAIKKLNIDYNECIFLDDIHLNCDAASKLGIQSIQVDENNISEAIQKIGESTSNEININLFFHKIDYISNLLKFNAASQITLYSFFKDT